MSKNIKTLLVTLFISTVLLLVLLFTKLTSYVTQKEEFYIFFGNIENIEGYTSFTIHPLPENENIDLYTEFNKIHVPQENIFISLKNSENIFDEIGNKISYDELSIGDTVLIYYDGLIEEISPLTARMDKLVLINVP